MTQLLLRLFVKDHKNTDAPAVRSSVGTLAGIVGIICNLLLCAGKMTVGILSASVSVTADALNNLSDAASSIVTLLGFQLAKRPADKDHPYGHGRYEYLTGLAISVLILFIGFELLKSSVSKIFQPAPSSYSWVMLGILVVSMAVKLWMSGFFSKLGKHIDSSALQASAIDSRNDVIATAVVLLGCVAEFLFSVGIDGYMGVAVSMFILYSGFKSARDTMSPLLGAQADQQLIQDLSQLILSHEKILGIHDLLIHDYGPGQCYASVHAELSAQYDPMVCHEIIDHVEAEVLSKLKVQLVIHFDPVATDDQEHILVQKAITDTLTQLGDDLSMHDLRIVKTAKAPLICFDVTLPYGREMDLSQLEAQLRENLPEPWKNYKLSIQVDRA